MSRIYFHSPSGTAEVSGRERAYAGLMCRDLLCVALGISGDPFTESTLYRKLLPPDAYPLRARSEPEFFHNLRAWLGGFMEPATFVLPDGRSIGTFEASLNTAVAMGSDAIRLLAKLHGQCEIHAYVEGPNRAWLADIIETGVEDKILRVWKDDHYGGWPAVIELLRKRDDEPVVTSYSVTRQFPNAEIAHDYGEWKVPIDMAALRQKYELTEDDDPSEWEADYSSDLWYHLTDAEQWKLAMSALRKANEKGMLEMNPGTFARQGYSSGLSGFDIMAAISG